MKVSFMEIHSQRTQLEKQPNHRTTYFMTLKVPWPTQILDSFYTFNSLLQV